MRIFKPNTTRKRAGIISALAGLVAALGLGIGYNHQRPPVIEKPGIEIPPVVEPPVVEPPVVEPPIVEDPISLRGKEWIILGMHFDGMKRLDSAGMSSWFTDAQEFATTAHSRGIPASWEMTASEVNRIGNPTWFAEMRALGITFAPRQPHQGDGTTADSIAALMAMNVPMASYVGSYISTDEFVNGPFSVLTGGGSIGHTDDPQWSGLRLAGFNDASGTPVVIVGAGTGNSTALKVKVAEYVRDGTYPYAIEVLRANGVSLDGKGENFVTPSKSPVPIFESIDKMTEELAQRRLSSYVTWTDYDTVVTGGRQAHEFTEYVVPRTDK